MEVKTDKHLNFSYFDFFAILVLTELTQNNDHAADLYRKLTERFPERKFSRTEFYRSIHKMMMNQWIESEPVQTNWKKTLTITHKGMDQLIWYRQHYTSNFEAVHQIAENLLRKVLVQPPKAFHLKITHDQRLFFSRLVNVADLVKYFFLDALERENGLVGAEWLAKMEETYGWHASDGYFYALLRQMEEISFWIVSRWDSHRRTKRYYSITERGQREVNKLRSKAEAELRKVYEYTRDALLLLRD